MRVPLLYPAGKFRLASGSVRWVQKGKRIRKERSGLTETGKRDLLGVVQHDK